MPVLFTSAPLLDDFHRHVELKITWFRFWQDSTLLSMQRRVIQRGRPVGATTFEAAPALAFGAVVRAARTEDGIAQEALAHLAGVERSHMGKIERGEHMPTLAMILKIAQALGRSSGELLLETEARLPDNWNQRRGR
jgi:XRE family transcriptional regulator, regulator of sulfur utilization